MTMSAPMPAPVKPPRSPLPTDRYWKLNYAKLELPTVDPRSAPPLFTLSAAAKAQGVVLCTLDEAQRSYADILATGLRSSVGDDETRFTELASGNTSSGFFCYIPPRVQVAETIKIAIGAASSWIGRGVIVVGTGAAASFTEENTAGNDAFVSGIVEIVLAEHASLRYTAIQDCGAGVRSFFTRRAVVAGDATINFATAELGALSSQSYLDARLAAPGARAEVTAIAFANHERYLDLSNDLEHAAPNTTSQTVIKAAALDHGRGRYYGNIRIKEHAHGSDATLRDDTLLLSRDANIDSVPALEISANDVKAFHGATVGSVDADQRFYAMTRGLSNQEAERMITLGFFEPAIARFSEEVVREFLRAQLAARVGQ